MSAHIQQRELVVKQKIVYLGLLNQATESLDAKAMGLVQASSIIISLTGAVAIPTAFTTNLTPQSLAALTLAFLAFVAMISVAIRAWRPSDFAFPGSKDWDEISTDYIQVDERQSYNQVLSDYLNSIDSFSAVNERKARLVEWSARLLIVQVIGILAAALLA